jgi:hypothetical protein
VLAMVACRLAHSAEVPSPAFARSCRDSSPMPGRSSQWSLRGRRIARPREEKWTDFD